MAPIPSSMRTVQINKNGGVEVLEHNTVPVPTPAANEVLIRNRFSGINFIDTYFRTGLYPAPAFPLNALPDRLRAFVESAAESIGCPPDFVAVPVLLGLIALLASWIPGRRAGKVDPLVALRYE